MFSKRELSVLGEFSSLFYQKKKKRKTKTSLVKQSFVVHLEDLSLFGVKLRGGGRLEAEL